MSEANNIPQIQEILIGCISPSPMNPRKSFNEDALRELAENIRQQGLLQPITVRHETYKDDEGKVHRIENAFEIICGERRYRACKMISTIMHVLTASSYAGALPASVTPVITAVSLLT